MCPLWFCTLLTYRYVASKGPGPACRGVFSSGGSEACALPRHHGVRMARDTHVTARRLNNNVRYHSLLSCRSLALILYG